MDSGVYQAGTVEGNDRVEVDNHSPVIRRKNMHMTNTTKAALAGGVLAAAIGITVAPAFAQSSVAGLKAPTVDEVTDSDHDGVTDAHERRNGTDPHKADTDQDGVTDGLEKRDNTDGSNPQDRRPSEAKSTESATATTTTVAANPSGEVSATAPSPEVQGEYAEVPAETRVAYPGPVNAGADNTVYTPGQSLAVTGGFGF